MNKKQHGIEPYSNLVLHTLLIYLYIILHIGVLISNTNDKLRNNMQKSMGNDQLYGPIIQI